MITDSNLKHLQEITDKVEKLPVVSKVDSLAKLIPEDQPEKIKIIKQFNPLLGNFRIALKGNNYTDADYIKEINQLIAYFEEAQDKAFSGGQSKLVEQIDKVI